MVRVDPYPFHGPLTRYVKFQVAHAPGMPGTFSPRRQFQRKPLFSDPGMHHGTCVTHVPWCMSGSLTCGDGENIPGIPGACAPAILRIWQEAHGRVAPICASEQGPLPVHIICMYGTKPLSDPMQVYCLLDHYENNLGTFDFEDNNFNARRCI